MPCARSLKLIFGEDSRLQNIFAVIYDWQTYIVRPALRLLERLVIAADT